MDEDCWEARMAERSKARGANGPRYHDGTKVEDELYDLEHEGHYQYTIGNMNKCSRGETLGVFTVALSDDEITMLRLSNIKEKPFG